MPAHLLDLARRRIASGALPTSVPKRAIGGPSAGGPCAVCSEPITLKAPEIEAQYRSSGGRCTYLIMHPPCYSAWLATALAQRAHA